MTWTVTRQIQYPDGDKLVEISAGGIDYTNPGALAEKYAGEFRSFDDPREAVETAIEICRQWRLDDKDKTIGIGYGATGGCTMPFDRSTFEEVREWANKRWESLPKCDHCGDPLPGENKRWGHEWSDGHPFCSENCANVDWDNQQRELEEEP